MDSRRCFALALAAGAVLCSPAFAATLTGGNLEIVVATDAAPSVKFAAEEAKTFLSQTLGADVPAMQRGLSRFAGADRRFQVKGSLNGAMIVDDYAHHPTEIKATLNAAKNVPHREIWCVFQPHTFTRTKKLMKEFAEALALADHVILAKIYPAREKDDLGISSDTLRERMAALGADVCYLDSFEEIKARLRSVCAPGDLILTMGAGDVVQIGDDLAAGR